MDTPKNKHPFRYNSEQDQIILREYGRNIQNMVRHLSQIEDIELRTKAAHTLVYLMKQLNPVARDYQDNPQRVWDHVYIMANLDLELDLPYPPPSKDLFHTKPQPLQYNKKQLKNKTLGRHLEHIIEKACATEDPEERLSAVGIIGKLLKNYYNTNNKDLSNDEVLLRYVEEITEGRLTAPIEQIREYRLFEEHNPVPPSNISNENRPHHHKNFHRKGNPRNFRRNKS